MILTISSLKGGVGKTTIAAYLAQALREAGKRVLCVDLDHNNNLTDFHLRNLDDATAEGIEEANVRHLLTCKRPASAVLWPSPMGDIIPATLMLATVGIELAQNPMLLLGFSSQIKALGYDHVIIDTPPSLGVEMTAGLLAADVVLVPVSSSRWALQNFTVTENEARKVELAGRPMPRMIAVPSMVTETEAAMLQDVPAWTASKAAIRRDPAVKQAASDGRRLTLGTIAARTFESLAAEVVG